MDIAKEKGTKIDELHKDTHQDGGADEISIVGLSGSASFTELAGGQGKNVTSTSTWEDYDLSAIIGAGAVAALIQITCSSAQTTGARKNGSALTRTFAQAIGDRALLTECDANRIVEIYSISVAAVTFNILGYWS